jgi:hypothetical protein
MMLGESGNADLASTSQRDDEKRRAYEASQVHKGNTNA